MKELAAPQIVGEDEILLTGFGRKVVKRWFQYPNDPEPKDWMLWGGTKGAPAIVFPVTIDGEVIAIWQFRHAPTPPRFLWELPGGNPEKIETSADIARDELAKETGYAAENFEVLGGGWVFFDPASCFTPFVAVLGRNCRKVGPPNPEKTEVIKVQTFSVQEWDRMINSGEVQDSKSITTTLLALRRLGWYTITEPK